MLFLTLFYVKIRYNLIRHALEHWHLLQKNTIFQNITEHWKDNINHSHIVYYSTFHLANQFIIAHLISSVILQPSEHVKREREWKKTVFGLEDPVEWRRRWKRGEIGSTKWARAKEGHLKKWKGMAIELKKCQYPYSPDNYTANNILQWGMSK